MDYRNARSLSSFDRNQLVALKEFFNGKGCGKSELRMYYSLADEFSYSCNRFTEQKFRVSDYNDNCPCKVISSDGKEEEECVSIHAIRALSKWNPEEVDKFEVFFFGYMKRLRIIPVSSPEAYSDTELKILKALGNILERTEPDIDIDTLKLQEIYVGSSVLRDTLHELYPGHTDEFYLNRERSFVDGFNVKNPLIVNAEQESDESSESGLNLFDEYSIDHHRDFDDNDKINPLSFKKTEYIFRMLELTGRLMQKTRDAISLYLTVNLINSNRSRMDESEMVFANPDMLSALKAEYHFISKDYPWILDFINDKGRIPYNSEIAGRMGILRSRFSKIISDFIAFGSALLDKISKDGGVADEF